MLRSAAVLLALLILPSLAPAQVLTTPQQGTHEVVKGETLWALAERYLGDPFRWPLIYEANRDRIENPHWIYPHQVFIIPGLEGEPTPPQAQVQDVAVVAPGQEGEPTAVRGDLPACPTASGRTVFYPGGRDEECQVPVPDPEDRTAFYVDPSRVTGSISSARSFDRYAVPRGVVYATPWLEEVEAEVDFVGTIATLAQVDPDLTTRNVAASFDRLQIELERGEELKIGDLLQSFVVGRVQEGLGQVIRPTGILVVTAVEEAGVVAMVSAEFARVALGQKVRRVPEYALPVNARAQDVESDLMANILGFDETLVIQGTTAVAFLDVGEEEGVSIGDEFLAYVNRGEGWEGEEVGRLQVVLVNGNVASARVLAVSDPALKPGITLHLDKKMH